MKDLSSYLRSLVCVGLLVASAGATLADHVSGHDDCDPTFPAPIPGEEFFNGGGAVVFVTLIGPVADTLVTSTTFDITFVSDGEMPASELELGVRFSVNGQTAEVRVLGSDLGFGSGPGTFVGTLQTDAFNGVVDPGIPGPAVHLQISRSNGDGVAGTAFFVDSAIVFDVVPPPPCDGPGGAVCGDGAVEGDEECDDGNTIPGDGCDADCNVEPNAGQICVCHIPPGNSSAAHTICIAAPAVSAHLAHGDTLGACTEGAATGGRGVDLEQRAGGESDQKVRPDRILAPLSPASRDRLLAALATEADPARELGLIGRLVGRVDPTFNPLLAEHLRQIRRQAPRDRAHLIRLADALLRDLSD